MLGNPIFISAPLHPGMGSVNGGVSASGEVGKEREKLTSETDGMGMKKTSHTCLTFLFLSIFHMFNIFIIYTIYFYKEKLILFFIFNIH